MIEQIKNNLKPAVLGIIRMGERTVKGHPVNSEHFILTDAPEVAEYYGNEPKELDVFFMNDVIDDVAPNNYMWFGGGKINSEGKNIGGTCYCQGNGVTASFYKNRDPITRIVPTRQCLHAGTAAHEKGAPHDACPDWDKCNPYMSMYMYLPLATTRGLFKLNTTSWITIRNVMEALHSTLETNGTLRGVPFKLYKTVRVFEAPDRNGKLVPTKVPIVLLKDNGLMFMKEHSSKLNAAAMRMLNQSVYTPDPVAMLSVNTEIINEVVDATPAAQPTQSMETVAETPELAPLFEQLAKLKHQSNTAKVRLMTARKFEKEQNPVEALAAYLRAGISQSAPAEQSAPLPSVPPPPSSPLPNAEGLI